MPTLKNLAGQRFGRLIAIDRAASVKANTRWTCLCDCGEQCDVIGSKLTSGHTKSCGCYRQDRSSELSRRHGMFGTATFNVWKHMVGRCNNPANDAFANYGGRGITVCDAWMTFEGFYSDMGERPDGMTLDRRDNSRGYSPDNCRWTTRKVQANNTRRNVVVEIQNGQRMTLTEYCESFGLEYHTVKSQRLRKGIIPGAKEVRA